MSLAYNFEEEINMIRNSKIKDFTFQALEQVPDYYFDAKVGKWSFIQYVERVVQITNDICDMLNCEDYARDALISSALLHDCTRFDMLDELNIVEDITHPLTVRTFLFSLQGIVGRDDFDGLMRIIEGSHGFHSIIPQVQPKMNDPIQMWVIPIASHLATKESA